MADVFISHARGDRKRVAPMAAALEAEGFAVAWDDQGRGEDAPRALAGARCVIVCWSRASVRSEAALREATQAYNQRKLAPAMLQAVEPPLPFNMVESADLTQWRGDGEDRAWRALLHEVRALAGGEAGAGLGRATPAPITPYAPEEEAVAIETRPRLKAIGAPVARWTLAACVAAAVIAGLFWAGPQIARFTSSHPLPAIAFGRPAPSQAQAAPGAPAAEADGAGEPASAPER
ncbi:MAG: toll/interleukin-1 receptor domain-containing protein [Hyphomonadaceae bacterium]